MGTDRTALVLGVTGAAGRAVARELLARGWRVRALHRDPEGARRRRGAFAGIEWLQGDAMDQVRVVSAAQGAAVIFHGVNPPGYRNWRELGPPMLQNTIAAAQIHGARILFPGNVYNFGPDAWPILHEDSPQNPRTRKGTIRKMMEECLRRGAGAGARVLVLRAGDFFGPGTATSSWFGAALVRQGKPLRAIQYPGDRKAGHAWAYVPDLAATFADLAERERALPDFERLHFGGHWLEPGIEMAESIRRVAQNPRLPVHSMPWPLLRLATPFVPLFRELLEMRYLWQVPVQLDNRKLVALLGHEPHTPLDTAVRRTLDDLGCLQGAAPE